MHQYTTAPPADPLKQARTDLDNVYVVHLPFPWPCSSTSAWHLESMTYKSNDADVQQRHHGAEHRLDSAKRRTSRLAGRQDGYSRRTGVRFQTRGQVCQKTTVVAQRPDHGAVGRSRRGKSKPIFSTRNLLMAVPALCPDRSVLRCRAPLPRGMSVYRLFFAL